MNEIRLYVGIWLGLIVGTLLEVAVRSLSGTNSLIVLVIAIIASAQAIVISLYYQNLRYEGISVATLPLAAVVGAVLLGVTSITSIAIGL